MNTRLTLLVSFPLLVVGCAPTNPAPEVYVPALKYAGNPAAAMTQNGLQWKGALEESTLEDGRTQMRLAQGPQDRRASLSPAAYDGKGALVTPTGSPSPHGAMPADVRVMQSSDRIGQPYAGPLMEGDPGVTASLWRESQAGNEPFRDFRAWQAMDLVTIVVNELSLGRHNGITEVKSKSEFLAAIENFLGLEQQTQKWSQPPDLASLIKASTQNDFRGEGRTIREGQLNARMSAVVAEVLPSGLLRIEGEKIIAVNNEEQVMVISGLVRQRDISFDNEVNASKIAQVRIDYYGKGTVGEAQYGGWLARALRILWPF